MTAFLRINGITVNVLDGSADGGLEVIGRAARGTDASLVAERRAIKRNWKFSTTPQAPATGLAFRDLLIGRGWVWDFETGTGVYPANGGAIASGGAQSGTQKKFGSFGFSVTAASSATFTFNSFTPSSLPWTVSYWFWNGTTWDHRVDSSAGWGYVNGSLGTSLTTAGATTLSIFNSAGATRYLDDVWACPYVWPTDWPAQVYAYATKAALAPALAVDGLLIENNLAGGAVVLGELDGVRTMQAYNGAVWAPNMLTVSGTLTEV
jgi:hypothetical protein